MFVWSIAIFIYLLTFQFDDLMTEHHDQTTDMENRITQLQSLMEEKVKVFAHL